MMISFVIKIHLLYFIFFAQKFVCVSVCCGRKREREREIVECNCVNLNERFYLIGFHFGKELIVNLLLSLITTVLNLKYIYFFFHRGSEKEEEEEEQK